jgi:hypothetical protein
MLGQTPGIVTDLGFLTRHIAALLVSLLISVTAIIARTTYEQAERLDSIDTDSNRP